MQISFTVRNVIKKSHRSSVKRKYTIQSDHFKLISLFIIFIHIGYFRAVFKRIRLSFCKVPGNHGYGFGSGDRHFRSSSTYSFIHYGDLYSACSGLLLRRTPDPCAAKKNSFQARVECVGMNLGEWGAITVPKEAQSAQRDQPPRMHGLGLWRYEQKEQRVTSVPLSGVNCDLWCPGWDSKDLGGRSEQDPGYTSKPWHQYGT